MKKIIFLLVSVLFAFFTYEAQAQQETAISHIHLKNDGGLFKGQILKADSAGWTILQLTNGVVLHLKKNSIQKIRTVIRYGQILKKGHSVPTKGFYWGLHTGVALGYTSGDLARPVVGANFFSFSFGHQFNPHVQVGGGIALDVYDHEFLPLFAEIRYFPKIMRWSPYAALQTGYAFSFNLLTPFSSGIYGGGPMVHPAVGVRLATRSNCNLLFEAGYRFQWGTIVDEWQNNVVDKLLYRRLSLRLGFEF